MGRRGEHCRHPAQNRCPGLSGTCVLGIKEGQTWQESLQDSYGLSPGRSDPALRRPHRRAEPAARKASRIKWRPPSR